MKSFVLRSPQGEIVKGWGLSKFARENNLDNNLIGKVVNGEVWQHKGWTHPDKSPEEFSVRPSGPFTLVSPEGDILKGRNLKEFCSEKGLSYRVICQVVRGNKAQYKGWRLPTSSN